MINILQKNVREFYMENSKFVESNFDVYLDYFDEVSKRGEESCFIMCSTYISGKYYVPTVGDLIYLKNKLNKMGFICHLNEKKSFSSLEISWKKNNKQLSFEF